MKKIETSVIRLMTMFFALLFCFCACGQKLTLYNKDLVTKSTELNLAASEKRGIETNSGIIYFVEKDMQTLTAYDKDTILWKTDIGKMFPTPVPGQNEIRFIQLQSKTIVVTYGKHCFSSVNINNGKATNIACD